MKLVLLFLNKVLKVEIKLNNFELLSNSSIGTLLHENPFIYSKIYNK